MKITLLAIVSAILLPGTPPEGAGPMRIEGRIPDIAQGEMVLVAQTIAGVDTLARAPITEGRFLIETPLREAYVATLKVAGYEGGFPMIAEPGATFTAELYQSSGTISGGRQHELLLNYQKEVQRYNELINELKTALEKATRERKFKTASELKKEVAGTVGRATHSLDSIVNLHRGTVFAAYILTDGIRRSEQEQMRANLARLTAQERRTQPAQLYESYIEGLARLDVGAEAPDFTLPDTDGQQVSLYGLEGRVKVIDFWASWCGPCRLENPNMVTLYNDYKDKGLTVVSVSLDENREKWLKAIEDDGLEWTHLSSLDGWKSSVVQLYNIDAVPTIFVLDCENRIVAKNLRGERLRELVGRMLD